ncbi:hypothetical protein [Acinetobacter sp. Marseille-Q1618]|uniref:hypothetical protein n=1 Tax=Acinetobacter sp. Marseille-Q1618 TaxID=2697502 RepID=UPI00156E855F|nr:hypothetical protein [Acinetobacter sp. Marseille-Q1618]
MAKITYSGLQAAFSFDGIQIGKGQTIELTGAELTKLQKGKVFKALLELGDLSVDDTQDGKATSRKGTSKSDPELDKVRTELKALDVSYADDETLEQLQAKLAQAKE